MEEPTRYLRRCPRCGATVSPRAKFCSECGMRLPEEGSSPQSPHGDERTTLLPERHTVSQQRSVNEEPTRLLVHRTPGEEQSTSGESDTAFVEEDDATRVLSHRGGSREPVQSSEDQPTIDAPTQVVDRGHRPEYGTPSEDGSFADGERAAGEVPSGWQRVPPKASAGEALTWKARAWLRRCMDRLVGTDIRDASASQKVDNGISRKLRTARWPERLVMPKLAALIGGVLCLVLDWRPWLAASAVQTSGGLSSIATLDPFGIVRNSWELLGAVGRGVGVSSGTLSGTGFELSALIGSSSSTLSLVISVVLLILGLVRLITLIVLALGIVSALVGESPYRFSALRRGIVWTFWSAAAWLVALPRFGWGVVTPTVSSERTLSITGIVMSYSAGRSAWIALVVSLVTLLVVRAWSRSHVVYPWA